MGSDPCLWKHLTFSKIEGRVRQRGNEEWIDFLNWLATKTRHGRVPKFRNDSTD